MRLLAVLPSTQLTKKLMAVFRDDDGKNKTVHFGSSYHLDFIKYSALSPTLAFKKKASYISRHGATEDWSDPTTAGTLSRYLLWEKPTLKDALATYKRRFKV